MIRIFYVVTWEKNPGGIKMDNFISVDESRSGKINYEKVKITEKALEYFTSSSLKEFNTIDPYNKNKVHGWMNMAPNRKYGAMYIDSVNDMEVNQFIWGTPKMHYPHDKNGIYTWIKDIKRFECYEKLDGTNVFSFIYKDAVGNEYVAYKTRLMPFIKSDGKFGLFDLWNEVLDMYPDIPELVYRNGMSVSYEMYGRKNLVLVRYEDLINAKILFVRDDLGRIYTPKGMDVGSVGSCQLITEINEFSDLKEEYDKIRSYLETKIKVTKNNDPELQDLVEGIEGSIMYAITEDGCVQYKAKPDYVMDIHRKAGEGIPVHSIMTTVRNAFEMEDVVDVDLIVTLLKEEFSDEQIYKRMGTIHRVIVDMNIFMVLREQILDEYTKMKKEDDSFDINTDKGKVMRYFSGKMKEWNLDRRKANKVYTIIVDNFGFG